MSSLWNKNIRILDSEKQIEKRLRSHISQNLFRYFHTDGDLLLTKADRDYWSIILVYKFKPLKENCNVHYLYCKIPKSDWNITSIDKILVYNYKQSRQMALVEFNNLRYLYNIFNECPDNSLKTIKPLDFISKFNLILTEGVVNSFEIFEFLRKIGRKRNINKFPLFLIEKMGSWLGYVHKIGFNNFRNFPLFPTFNQQILKYKEIVKKLNVNSRVKCKLFGYFEKLEKIASNLILTSEKTFVIEGFEVRNFITDKKAIYFLDPGKISIGSLYEDLARFIASLAILYWGRIDFLFEFRNESCFFEKFINGYCKYVNLNLDYFILSIYLFKQYLKLWIDGLKVLIFKQYPRFVSNLIEKIYIEHFFSKRIENILKRI